MQSTGDLISIDIARIAIGKKVFRSRCALKLQLCTEDPYLLILFRNDESKKVEMKVYFEELEEFSFYLVDEEEEPDSYDNGLSIIAMHVTPSQQNKLLDFTEWYDGEGNNDSGMKYITMELRDVDQFNVSAWKVVPWSCAHSVLICFSVTQKIIVSRDKLDSYFSDEPIEFRFLGNYTKALVEDDEAEKAKRRSGPRTRPKGKSKMLSDSENKLLVVYPFKVDEDQLQHISSELNELGGDQLGVDEVVTDAEMLDAPEEDSEVEEGGENNPAETGRSSRTHHISIREDDKERLEPGQFLNDAIVDFWMSW
jgi:hypothetical protein